MSSEKNFWPKLRHPFRKPVTHETPQKLSDNDSKISNATRGSVIVPVFQVDPHKTSEYIAHTESVRSSSTGESWDPQDSSSHGDNYVSSLWSAQTGCTTPSANFSSFSGQAGLPAAYPGTCSPSTSGDLQGRLGDAYRHIQNMPPSPILPTISQLTGDPRTYHKQLGVPQHSVINQPMLKMPNLPNPHAAHERSHSQPLPSSFPSESLPVSWTWANVPERSSAPRYRHPQVKAQSPGYPHQPAKPSLQIDIDVHSNLSRPATTVHSSQTSPAMIVGPVKHYSADTTVPLSPQPEYSRIRPELSPQRRSKLIKRHSPAMSHVSSPSHSPYHAASEETRTQEDSNIRLELPLQKRSKLIKRRSPALSHVSSPPSSYPIASEEIGTPVSSNQESNSNRDVRNQNILPLVRPPSPLRLDMPIHQPWHDRRTNFELSPMRRSHYSSTSVALSTSTTQKASPSTEALASLAWIGASPMGTSLSTSSVSSHYTRYNPVPTDDEIDIYMAMDENLSDEAVVEQLEIIRKRSRKDKHRSLPVPRAASYGSASIPLSKQGCSPLGDHLASYPSSLCQSEESEPVTPLPVILDDLELDTDDAALWSTARRALFCIREIIGTERKYQEALKMLLTGQTANQPPPLLLTYLPDLVRASEALLRAFLDDPSAWGVSTAFMAREDDIEAAMVSWCGVAGNFFTDSPSNEGESANMRGKWRPRKSLLPSAANNSLAPVVEKSSGNSPLTSPPPLLTLMNEAGSRIRDRQRTVEHYWKVSDDGSVDSHAERRPRANSVDGRTKGEPPIRRHSVRDLAIQPTQRVMRYVLLYRDLLESTPHTSPSRALVERALEAATRIADRCDRAQDNTAFLHI